MLHLQRLTVANSSSLGRRGSNCCHSHPSLLNLPGPPQGLLRGPLHCRVVVESVSITPDEVQDHACPSPGCWPGTTFSSERQGPVAHLALFQGPKSFGQTCSALTAAAKSLVGFLSGVKNNFQLKFMLQMFSEAPHHGQRHEVWNFLCNTIYNLPGSNKPGVSPFNLGLPITVADT